MRKIGRIRRKATTIIVCSWNKICSNLSYENVHASLLVLLPEGFCIPFGLISFFFMKDLSFKNYLNLLTVSSSCLPIFFLLFAFLGNFLLIPYILETSQVRNRRISDVCSLHWTCNVPNVHAVDPGIRHILHSQPERLTKRCKSDFWPRTTLSLKSLKLRI